METETMDSFVKILREGCPLAPLLKEGKPCPHFGLSKDCTTCSYHWHVIAKRMLDAAGEKRLDCKRTRRRLKEVEEELASKKEGGIKDLSLRDVGFMLARGVVEKASDILKEMEKKYAESSDIDKSETGKERGAGS